LTSVTIPASVTNIGNTPFDDSYQIASITVEEGNPVYHSDGNCLIETSTGTLLAGCKTSVIPTDGSVTKIQDYAFQKLDIKTITIPSCIVYIGRGVFMSCYWLESVTFENPNGWFVTTSSTATSGTNLTAEDLLNPTTAAEYLTETYYYNYWKRV
jgi:hypothetical protein